MLSLLALAASTLLGIGIVVGLVLLFLPFTPPPIDYGTPEERHARRLATYRSRQ